MDTTSHIKDMENKETNVSVEIKDMSLLVNKPYIAYVFKKTHKIAQALYLVSDFFESSEPLRESIRKNANLLFQTSGAFLRNHQKDTENSSTDLVGLFLETQGLLETARMINLLSEKNHLILKDEIIKTINEIDSNKEKKIQLSREFMRTSSLEEDKRQSVLYKGQEDVLNLKDTVSGSFQKDVNVATPHKQAPSENKAHRSVQVIALFKPGAELMIKDIASHLKDVSEKTIQRELLSLVARGILRKKGEKRWSRYLLK